MFLQNVKQEMAAAQNLYLLIVMRYLRQVETIPTNSLWSITCKPTATNMVTESSEFYNKASQNTDETPDYLFTEPCD